LGRALREARDGGAEAAFVQCLSLDPGNARARYELGRLLRARGETADAAYQLRQALARAPSLVGAHRELAGMALAAKELGAAAAALKALLAWAPGDAGARNDLATANREINSRRP